MKDIKGQENKEENIAVNPETRLILYGCLILVSVIVVYFPAFKNGILQWDDNLYVTDNRAISSLLNIPSFFKSFFVGNYQPLTMITYSIIWHFSGASPFLYHFVNILFHVFNSLLVFYFVYELLKDNSVGYASSGVNPALIVSLLFGLHPLHVESVAWIAELKDVQYTFFFFLSLIFYLKFIRQRKPIFYILSVVVFLLSLLSKGQAVALFPTLLLIDYLERGKFLTRFIEKIPFLVLSLTFGIIAVIAQKSDNTIGDFSNVTFAEQLALAAYSFTMYIIKIIIPFNLSSFYPYPVMINGKIPGEYWSYLLIIPIALFSIIYAFKRNKLIFFGLLFFLANIILLLQILPVGNCIMADRYTYISSVGIFIIMAHALLKYAAFKNQYSIPLIFLLACYLVFLSVKTYSQTALWNKIPSIYPDIFAVGTFISLVYLFLNYIAFKKQNSVLIFMLSCYLVFLSVKTFSQTTFWKNDFKLWDHVLSIYPDISSALVLRGCAYNDREEYEKALADFNHSISLDPRDGLAYFNRGVSKSKLGDFTGALEDYKAADNLKIKKSYLFNFYVSWGGALANTGKINEAMQLFDKAIALDSMKAAVYNNRGITKAMTGDLNGALKDFNRAVLLKPDFDEAINNRDKALQSVGRKNIE